MIDQYEHSTLLLERISNHLIINASSLDNLGLYHGKMGVVLFFVHYARYTENSLYNDFAGELIDEIYRDIHSGFPLNFENGYCGIGWAIEYLLENNFMEGDPLRVLATIDKKIMEWDLNRINGTSEKNDLLGISYYIEKHLTHSLQKKEYYLLIKLILKIGDA